MAVMRNAVEIEVWKVSKLIDAVSNEPKGNNRITIPEFQRRLVWNQDTRKELINSIRSGYPFGTILLYEDVAKGQQAADSKHHFSLIDGLQRTQALKHYVEQQNGYFTRADLDDDFIDLIAERMGKETDEYRDRIRNCIVKWVKGRTSFEAAHGWDSTTLILTLLREVLDLPSDSLLLQKEFFAISQDARFTRAIGAFLDETSTVVKVVLDAEIPVLRFLGDPSELPRIFELINTKGTALSRYEIFAAQWIEIRRRIGNPDIISAIWSKYESLEDEGFTLDVADGAQDEQTRRDRDYTLFDYLFGFGQHISDKYPRLFKPAKGDRPSSCGFNLLTACVGLHISEMAALPDKIAAFDLNELEGCVLDSLRFVDNVLKPVLSGKRIKSKPPTIYHSELMIVAMIATAFQVRFSLRDLSDNPDWRADRRKLKRQLPMHYLYEILHDDWRGSGDSKLRDAVRSLRYLHAAPPTQRRWQQVLNDWYFSTQADNLHGRQRKPRIRENRPEYLLLRFVFSRRLQGAKTFHIEHIVPIENLQAQIQGDDEWPINTIGNLALLPEAGEFKNNFLTYVDMLQAKQENGDISAEQQNELSARYAEALLCPPDCLPNEPGKKAYQDFLSQRFDLLKQEFVEVWHSHIPPA